MKSARDIVFIFLAAFFFAGITAASNHMLAPRIALNNETRNSRFLLDVLGVEYPKAASPESIGELEKRLIERTNIDGLDVYGALNEKGQVTGYAFPVGGKGFWGGMRGLLALAADLDTVKGLVFTEHNDTPGLGARVDEQWFRDQFKGIRLSEGQAKGRFITVGRGDAQAKNRVEAITGATMTSTAVDRFLNEDISKIAALKDKIRSVQWRSQQRK
jgi:Na+-transporting NADH:ubiquinone oxidoreductase subunit C